MSDWEKEAALEFAKTKPIEWNVFKARWLSEHTKEPVPIPDIPPAESKRQPKVEVKRASSRRKEK